MPGQGQGGQNKVTGMEKIITRPRQAPVAHFVSGLYECEKKTVVWEIRNVVELLKIPRKKIMDNSGITFDAGHSIGIPATFCFYFIRFGKVGHGHIVNVLKLSPDSKAKNVKASCSISLSCGGVTIARGALVPQEFKDTDTETDDGDDDGGGFGWVYLRGRHHLVTEKDILRKTDNGQKGLKVTLTFNVHSSKDSVEVPKGNLLKAEEVISDFGMLLESEDGAGLEIRVPKKAGGEIDASAHTKMVHKGILMARSSVFAAMFAKGSEMVEATTGKVVIQDLSPKGLDIFLHFLYTGKVLDEWVKVPAEILNCAEKYDLGRLKQYCGQNLMAAVTTKNAWEMYHLAKLHKLSFARCAIAEFVSKNAKAVLDEGEDTDGSDTE